MRASDLVRLLVLAAIWGSSYLFIRILAPAIGPMLTVETRVAIAGVAILVYCAAIGLRIEWRRFGRHYLALGIINTAVPFMLYAFAALYLPASYSVIQLGLRLGRPLSLRKPGTSACRRLSA